MVTPPVVALPDFSKTFVFKCDASKQALGAVLMQEGRPLAYLSQALKGKNLFFLLMKKNFWLLFWQYKSGGTTYWATNS